MLLCLMTIPLSGCPLDTSAQRIEALEKVIVTSQETLERADEDVAALQLVITKSKAYLEGSGFDEELTAKIVGLLSKAQVEMEKALTKKTEVQSSLVRWQAQITEIKAGGEGLGAELKVYGEGLKHIGGYAPAPVGPWLGLGGTVVALIGSILLALKRAKKDTEIKDDKDDVAASIVRSVDELLRGFSKEGAAEARAVLKGNQSPSARNVVREIHAA